MSLTLQHRVLRVILPFCAGYFFSYLMRTINAVISPELTRELGLSAADLGLLTSTYFFSFALAQIPVGIGLDRFGARRVAASLLVVAGTGAILFGLGQSLTALAVARALIGLGVAACLMAGLKGFFDWFDVKFQPSLTGVIMASGAVGALTTSIPVTLALPVMGWRGIFIASGVLAISLSLITWWVVPEAARKASTSTLRDSIRGVVEVYKSRDFWRFAPQGAMFTGCFMALQGLWVVPWLMNVNGYSRAIAAEHLFAIGIGMLVGQLGLAALLARLHHKLAAYRSMQAGLLLMMSCQALAVLDIGPSLLVWGLWSAGAASGSQMYGVVASHFNSSLAGRATTAINLAAFVGAFCLQWGLGLAIDGLRAAGYGTTEAYRLSFAVVVVLQLAAYGWMLKSTMASRQPLAARTPG